MKRIAIGIGLLAALLAQGNLMAQGYFEFLNSGANPVLVQNAHLNGGLPVFIGTPAIKAGFIGCGPGQVTFDLFMAPNGTETLSQLLGTTFGLDGLPIGTPASTFLVGTAENEDTTLAFAQGTFCAARAPFPVTADVGSTVEWCILAFSQGGQYEALSPLETDYALTTSIDIPRFTFGPGPGQLDSLTLHLVPEQCSTMFLGALSVGAMMFFRHRK